MPQPRDMLARMAGTRRPASITSRGWRSVEKLNERYLRADIARHFVPSVHRALSELEGTSDIPAECVESVLRIIDTLVVRSAGVLESYHGGQYLLHMWRRSDALNRLLGGALDLVVRFALIELATFTCIEQSWQGCPPDAHPEEVPHTNAAGSATPSRFAPLHEPWWPLLNAVIKTKMIGDPRTQRWQEIIGHLRSTPVEGAPQNVACALAWAGIVDVERGELFDDDFARAAGRERRWFTVSRGFGLRLLGQVFLIWDHVIAQPSAASAGGVP